MAPDQLISINDYTYDLPEARIALHPLAERDQSKLLVYQGGSISHSIFSELSGFLPPDSILFFNNTKVIPARLHFQKQTGAEIEIFLLDPISPSSLVHVAMNAKQKSSWHCTVGNLKRWKENSTLKIENSNLQLKATLLDRENTVVELQWTPAHLTFAEVIQSVGNIPLPPYIKRKPETEDRTRYQTVYSKEDGAVAAPTAGLHFTENVLHSLNIKRITLDYLTLHVSAGTFQPVKVEHANAHVMHEEQVIITRQNILNLLQKKTVVAVGTTSLRTLESVYWYGTKLLNYPASDFVISQQDAYQLTPVDKQNALAAVLKKMDDDHSDQLIGRTSIFILPGYKFKICDALITNFHQPGSTLMLLVAAFVGPAWKKIYATALADNYRFLSYGDSSLLFPSK